MTLAGGWPCLSRQREKEQPKGKEKPKGQGESASLPSPPSPGQAPCPTWEGRVGQLPPSPAHPPCPKRKREGLACSLPQRGEGWTMAWPAFAAPLPDPGPLPLLERN